MRRTAIASIVLTLSAPLYAGDWYLGGGAGLSVGHDMGDYGSDVDKEDTAYNLFAGYQFNDYFAGELGYLNTGSWKSNLGTLKSDGATLSAIGRYPLNDRFSLFAEGGGYLYSANSPNGSDTNLAPLAGLGMTVRLHRLVDLQARYRYLVRVGDDAGNDNSNSGTRRWVSDVSTATLELVIHPNRDDPLPPAAPPPMAAPVPAPEPVQVDKTFEMSSDLLFDFNKASLKPEGEAALGDLYQRIKAEQPKDGMAMVYGHTDRLGSEAYNQTLSEARAQSVANYLIGLGLPADKVSAIGQGEHEPVTGQACDDKMSRAQLIPCLVPDRRVEIRITGVKQP
ncbi:OmpA family protein [Aeromonas schubertii]|uniref:OmpA family protein n=1 Tax=Aeromonas schubertii TaxID=652 RepID=UPI001CC4C1D4|nr:OmpA family protein [Aeromonas schubertii]MBZ6071546.1 OmpA family protein [Aeromonas schubertii]